MVTNIMERDKILSAAIKRFEYGSKLFHYIDIRYMQKLSNSSRINTTTNPLYLKSNYSTIDNGRKLSKTRMHRSILAEDAFCFTRESNLYKLSLYDNENANTKEAEDMSSEMKNMLLLNEQTKRTKDSIVHSQIFTYGKAFMFQKIKNKFGVEFMLSNYGNINRNKLLHEFFQKHIKDFDKNYVNNESGSIKSFISISKLDKGTYMYVSSKIYVPNKALSIMLDDENPGDLYIYLIGKKSYKYSKYIEKILKKTKEAERSKKILIINEVSGAGSGATDISVIGFDPRDNESLVYSNGEIEKIIDHIDRYLDSTEFYKSKQLPYKTGILLYGEPGTGKSTIVKTLATKYNRNIVQINISNIDKINFGELSTMINNDIYEEYIVLFEDIDTLYLNRETKKGEDANNLIQDLLQFLDSSSSPKNVIFVATTNHIDRLDKAIIRDGRFDLHVNVKGIEKKQIKKFCDIFEVSYEDNIDHILELYGEPDSEGLYNQSKLQNLLLQTRKPNMSEELKRGLTEMLSEATLSDYDKENRNA